MYLIARRSASHIGLEAVKIVSISMDTVTKMAQD